jgi:hypothetical protein
MLVELHIGERASSVVPVCASIIGVTERLVGRLRQDHFNPLVAAAINEFQVLCDQFAPRDAVFEG